jgi:RNA polymerase sigma-70 factor, ECF subfamily
LCNFTIPVQVTTNRQCFLFNKMVLKEQQQLRKIRKGDISSFEELFHQYYNGLCSYAQNLLGLKEVAEEVVQDVFYNIWKNRESLLIRQSLKSYLYRSAYNNSMMYLRKMRREYFMEDLSRPEPSMDAPDPLEVIQLDEVSGVILRTLEALPERTREIFRMNRQEGLKYREIAQKLSISEKTVEANMGKALKALRNSLERYEQQ